MVRRGVCIGKGWREMPKVGKLMKHRRFSHGVVAAALLPSSGRDLGAQLAPRKSCTTRRASSSRSRKKSCQLASTEPGSSRKRP